MRFRIYFASSVCLCVALLMSGCTKGGTAEVGGGGGVGVGGSGTGTTSGGTGTGTSGGTGTGTSGGTGTGTSGGTGTGGSGTTGGSGGSGGSGGAVVLPRGAPKFAIIDSGVKALQGLVNVGRSRAIAGARVYVLQVDTTGQGNSSLSLLTAATGNRRDSIGFYALTGEYGGFSIADDYKCTSGRQVYLYVRGGNGDANGGNSAIGLMASLGACPEAGNFTAAEPFVIVNEVTTVAAAYEMASGATDPTHISSFGILGAINGAKLARISTGVAIASPAPGTKIPQSTINTLANILFACVDSSGPTSPPCTTLFGNARVSDTIQSLPTDTAAAAINIAHHPRANISALYSLQPQVKAPFQPYLAVAPTDFTISPKQETMVSSIAPTSPQH